MLRFLISQLLLLVVVNFLFKISVGAEVKEYIVEPHCSNNKREEIEAHLSTKTPYRVVANLNDSPLKYPGCQPQRMWTVVRHGTRNPSKKIIKQAHKDLKNLKHRILNNPNNKFCTEELARLRFWKFNATVSEEKYLVPEGEDELLELAERMQHRFPDLLPDYYDPSLYYFKYTATQRTEKSAKSFATGLFGRQKLDAIIYPEPIDKDPILRVGTLTFTSIC